MQFEFPFVDYAMDYREAGWKGTIPLREKAKEPNVIGFHGAAAPNPTDEQLEEWRKEKKHKRANIGLRLTDVDKEFEVLGIDVDHYESGGKQKIGGDTLKDLEGRFGGLPDTYISSARTDGISGIRFFRVPKGLSFRGKAGPGIDIISRGNRYAVVWPSWHPELKTEYWWFPPGVPLTPEGRLEWNLKIPNPNSFALLPDVGM